MRYINLILLFVSLNACSQVSINGEGSPVRINGSGIPLGVNAQNHVTGNEIDVYILAGQSNVGRSRVVEMTASEAGSYSGTVLNAKVLNPYISTTAVNNLNIGVNTMLTDQLNLDEFGAEAALLKSLPTNRRRYLLKYGAGNTSMQAFWSAAANRVGWLNIEAYTRSMVNVIIADGKVPILKAFIWMQGESDAGSESFANNYGWRLQACRDSFAVLWDSILTANSLPAQSYKWVVGRIKLTDALYDDTLRAQQASFCAVQSNNAVLINTDSYPLRDASHYSATGQISFGLAILTALQNSIFILLIIPFRKYKS